jgi:hypothetical protein
MRVKVNLTLDFTMSLVGVLMFASYFKMIVIQNFTAMMYFVQSVVIGVALAGRMVLYSEL